MPTDQRAHWNSVYSGNSDYFGQEPSWFGRKCGEEMAAAGAKRILELGPGQGRDTRFFLEKGMFVLAADYSERSCRDLKERFMDSVSVLHTDLKDGLNLPKDSLDACYSHMLFTMDFTDPEAANLMDDVSVSVKPGGMIYFSVRNKNDPSFGKGERIDDDIWENNGFAVRFWSEEDIRRLFGRYDIKAVEEFSENGKVLYGVTIRNRD